MGILDDPFGVAQAAAEEVNATGWDPLTSPRTPRPGGMQRADELWSQLLGRPTPTDSPGWQEAREQWFSTPLPTTREGWEAVKEYWDELGVDALAVGRVMRNSAALLSSPEVITAMRAEIGGAQAPPQMSGAQYITGLITESLDTSRDLEDVEEQLMVRPYTADFFKEFSYLLKPWEKEMIMYTLIHLDASDRDQPLALLYQIFKQDPPTTDEERMQMLQVFYNAAQQSQERRLSYENGWFGQLSNWLATPFESVSEGVSSLWSKIADPDDYKWREPLSIGQNVAISLGVEPDDIEWQWVSGAVDFFANFVLDPINLAAGFGFGAKSAGMYGRLVGKGLGIGEDLTHMGRLGLTMRAGIPFYGRSVIKKYSALPRGMRGPYSRMGWAMFNRTYGELAERAIANGAGRRIAEVIVNAYKAQKGSRGTAELLELFPEFKTAPDLVAMLVDVVGRKSDNLDEATDFVNQVLRELPTGDGIVKSTVILEELEHAKDGAAAAYKAAYERALANGELRLDHMIDTDMLHPNFVWKAAAGDEEKLVGVVSRVDPKTFGKNGEVVGLSGEVEPKIFYLTQDNMKGLLGTMGKSRGKHVRRYAVEVKPYFDEILAAGSEKEKTQALQKAFKEVKGFKTWFMKHINGQWHGVSAELFGGDVMFTKKGRDALVRMKDVDGGVSLLQHNDLAQLHRQKIATQQRLDAFKAADVPRTWVVVDFPFTKPPKLLKGIKGLWRNPAAGGLKKDASWIRKVGNRFHNAVKRDLFTKEAPRTVRLSHTAEARDGIVAWMRMVHAPPEEIARFMDEWADIPYADRYHYVQDLKVRIGHLTDNPYLRNQLIESGESAGGHFAKLDGAEIAKRPSRAEDSDRLVPIPVFPSTITDHVLLPGHEVVASWKRWKRGNRWLSSSGRRGMFSRTTKKRERLVDMLRARLGPAGRAMDVEELEALAFGLTRGRHRNLQGFQDGLGAWSSVARGLGRAYDMGVRTFSLAMLAGRPFAWMARVVLLEEGWRGAMMEQPSVYRNPVRAIQSMWDAHVLDSQKARVMAQVEMVDQVVDTAFGGTRKVDDALKIAKQLTGEDIKGATVAEIRGRTANHIGAAVRRGEGGQAAFGRLDNITRKALRRQEKIRKGRHKYGEYGLDPEFSLLDDVGEIQNKGLHSLAAREIEATSMPLEWGPDMGPKAVEQYGHGYARVLENFANDEILSTYGVKHVAAELSGAGPASVVGYGAEDLVKTAGWRKVRRNVRADYEQAKGHPPLSDLDAAQWYLEERVIPYTKEVLRPFHLDGSAAAVEAFGSKNVSLEVAGKRFNFRFGEMQGASNADEGRRFALHMNGQGLGDMMPPQIAAFFDAGLMGHITEKNLVRKSVDHIMYWAGEKATQTISRHPAWYSTFRTEKKIRKALGWSDEFAAHAAALKATERVNYIYYNLGNVTPFLRRMARVHPFFQATWEVVQTWSYKIPMTGWGLTGYAEMFRKVDRVKNAMVSLGLVDVDDEGRWTINVGPEAVEGQNALGQVLSAGMYGLASAGMLIPMGIGALWQAIPGVDGDVKFDFPDRIRFSAGNPLDWNSHGIGGVNQFNIGVNPIVGYGISRFLGTRLMQNIVDYKKETAAAGETLPEIAERLDVSLHDLMNLNRSQLEEQLSAETIALLYSEDLDPSFVALTADIDLRVPNTNLAMDLIENFYLPFGRVDAGIGALYNFAPSWLGKIIQGFGIGGDGGVNDMGGFIPPMSQNQMHSEMTNQLMHLEAEGQYISKITSLLAKEQEIVERAMSGEYEEGLDIEVTDARTRILHNPEHPLAGEWQKVATDIRDLTDEIFHLASVNATGTFMMRGFSGFFMPAMPQVLAEEQMQLANFYFGRERADVDDLEEMRNVRLPEGGFTWMGEGNAYDGFQTLVQSWLMAPNGDYARGIVEELYPGMLPYTFGKTVWGGIGEPPEITGLEGIFNQLRDGSREYPPADVWLVRTARAMARLDFELEMAAAFGVDSAHNQALRALQDPLRFRELKERRNDALDQIAWWDGEFNEGGYADWAEEHYDDELSFSDRFFDELDSVIDSTDQLAELLEMADYQDLTLEDRRTVRSVLGNLESSMKDWKYGWLDEFGGERNFRHPRDEVIADYYIQLGAYYDQIDELYTRVDGVDTDEEAKWLYEEIRALENTAGLRPIWMNGIGFPAPLRYTMSGYTEERRAEQHRRWLVGNPAWLNLAKTEELRSAFPEIAHFLPTPATEAVWSRYNERVIRAQELLQPGPDGSRVFTERQYYEAMDQIEEDLHLELIQVGGGDQFQWREMTPAERLNAVGMLPPVLDDYLAMSRSMFAELERLEKGISSDEGQRMLAMIMHRAMEDALRNPEIGEAIRELAFEFYGNGEQDAFFPKFFGGMFWASAEV